MVIRNSITCRIIVYEAADGIWDMDQVNSDYVLGKNEFEFDNILKAKLKRDEMNMIDYSSLNKKDALNMVLQLILQYKWNSDTYIGCSEYEQATEELLEYVSNIIENTK